MGARRIEVAVAVLLLVVMVVSVQPQYVLGTLAPLILEDLDGSHVGYGSLITVMFLAAGAASPLAGRVTDRLGPGSVLFVFFATATAAVTAIALAPSMAALFVAAGVGGLGLAWSNPVTNRLLVSRISEGRRGVVLGVKQSGVTLGIVVSGVSLPGLAVLLGWRRSVLLLAALIVLAGTVTTIVALAGRAVEDADASVPAGARRPGRWLVSYAFFMGAGISATTAYLILYAHEDLGLSLQWAGVLLACHGCMGVVSRVAMGVVAHRLRELEVVLVALALGAVAATALIMLSTPSTLVLVWIGTLLMGCTGSSWNVAAIYLLLREVGPHHNGAATGLLQRGFYAGFCLCPLGFGAVVELSSNYELAWLLVLGAFGAGAATVALTRVRRTKRAERNDRAKTA